MVSWASASSVRIIDCRSISSKNEFLNSIDDSTNVIVKLEKGARFANRRGGAGSDEANGLLAGHRRGE